MYLSLVVFAMRREVTSEVAGPSLEENKWGFGQVMAMAAWLPTLLDFVLIAKGE